MSTDTALALGLLALLGRDVPDRVRVFLLTVFVVDDLVALLVIAVVYSESVIAGRRCWSRCVAFGGFLLLLRSGLRHPLRLPALAAVLLWTLLLDERRRPGGGRPGDRARRRRRTRPTRDTLEEASGLFRDFREQPTAELARTASVGLTSTLSPNARLQRLLPARGRSYLDRAAVRAGQRRRRDRRRLPRRGPSPRRSRSASSSGYVVGKPVAVLGASWARRAAEPGPDPAAGRLGRGARQRHDRRHRRSRCRC